tara:strand:+ start:61 stop:1218 length:1158 start_codon:yes stop_codon:yes gene_type:complete
MSKTASPEAAEKETGISKDEQRVGKVTYSKDGDTKFTVTNINPDTGQISWKVTDLPAFDKLLDDADALIATSKGVYTKTKDDEKFREFYEEARVIRNKIRKHLRNEYPEEYKRMQMFKEGEIDEISTTGGGAGAASFSAGTGMQYATPYAFRKKGAKPDDEEYMKLGYRLAKEGTCGYDRDNKGKKLKGPGGLGEGDTYEKMAAKGKKAGSLKQGTVRKRLGIKKGEKIPLSKINKELARLKKMDKDDDKKGVQLGDKNQKYYKALQLSKTLKTTTNVNEEVKVGDILTKDGRKGKVVKVMDDMANVDFGNGDVYGITFRRIKGNKIVNENDKDPGATLGPGPKATEDGVKDNYYVKAFKYKLVPKTKDGTYVQKGSGLDVNKLF